MRIGVRFFSVVCVISVSVWNVGLLVWFLFVVKVNGIVIISDSVSGIISVWCLV